MPLFLYILIGKLRLYSRPSIWSGKRVCLYFCTFEQEKVSLFPPYFWSGKRCLYSCTSIDLIMETVSLFLIRETVSLFLHFFYQGNGFSIPALLLIVETVSLFLIRETVFLFLYLFWSGKPCPLFLHFCWSWKRCLYFWSGKRWLYSFDHGNGVSISDQGNGDSIFVLLNRETVSLFPPFFWSEKRCLYFWSGKRCFYLCTYYQGNGVFVPAFHGESEAACGVPGRPPLLHDRQGADSLQVSPSVLRTVRIRIRLLTLMPDPDHVFLIKVIQTMQPRLLCERSQPQNLMRIRIRLFTLMRIRLPKMVRIRVRTIFLSGVLRKEILAPCKRKRAMDENFSSDKESQIISISLCVSISWLKLEGGYATNARVGTVHQTCTGFT